MGKRSNIDFASLKVADIPKLNGYQRHRYDVWVKTQERKKQIKNDNVHGFVECFNKSCEAYICASKIKEP